MATGPVVQRMDNTIHWINHYPGYRVVCSVNTYPLDSDLCGGWRLIHPLNNWGQDCGSSSFTGLTFINYLLALGVLYNGRGTATCMYI